MGGGCSWALTRRALKVRRKMTHAAKAVGWAGMDGIVRPRGDATKRRVARHMIDRCGLGFVRDVRPQWYVRVPGTWTRPASGPAKRRGVAMRKLGFLAILLGAVASFTRADTRPKPPPHAET